MKTNNIYRHLHSGRNSKISRLYFCRGRAGRGKAGTQFWSPALNEDKEILVFFCAFSNTISINPEISVIPV